MREPLLYNDQSERRSCFQDREMARKEETETQLCSCFRRSPDDFDDVLTRFFGLNHSVFHSREISTRVD